MMALILIQHNLISTNYRVIRNTMGDSEYRIETRGGSESTQERKMYTPSKEICVDKLIHTTINNNKNNNNNKNTK